MNIFAACCYGKLSKCSDRDINSVIGYLMDLRDFWFLLHITMVQGGGI